MLRKLVIGAAVVLIAFFAVAALQPPTFHVERSITTSAPPADVFAQVNDFHAWTAWSPWEKLDPQLKRTYSGSPAGAGAQYAWAGNKEVGEGRMTIEKSESPSLVSIKLEFLKPFTATNTATFTFKPVPEGTQVTWAMDGTNNLLAKAMHLVMNMDKMVGGDFEKGLASMKAAAEARAKSGVQTAEVTK